MRKIEEAMNRAIYLSKNATIGNTKVMHTEGAGQHFVSVYLHGHMIAQRINGEWSISLAGWNTPTTRSRLNGLLAVQSAARARVYTVKGTVYLQVGTETREIDSSSWHKVN